MLSPLKKLREVHYIPSSPHPKDGGGLYYQGRQYLVTLPPEGWLCTPTPHQMVEWFYNPLDFCILPWWSIMIAPLILIKTYLHANYFLWQTYTHIRSLMSSSAHSTAKCPERTQSFLSNYRQRQSVLKHYFLPFFLSSHFCVAIFISFIHLFIFAGRPKDIN